MAGSGTSDDSVKKKEEGEKEEALVCKDTIPSIEELKKQFPLMGMRRLMNEREECMRRQRIAREQKVSLSNGLWMMAWVWILVLSIIAVHIYRIVTEGVEYLGKGGPISTLKLIVGQIGESMGIDMNKLL